MRETAAQAPLTEKLVTASDLPRLGLEGPYELVDGRIVPMSPASGKHGLVASSTEDCLKDFARPRGVGRVVSAETGFLVRRSPDRVRAPDVAFVSNELVAALEASGEAFFPRAPELAVEVLSPDDAWEKVQEKVQDYLGAGGKLVWVISPSAGLVYVFSSDAPPSILRKQDEIVGGLALPGFRCRVAALFGESTP